MLDIAADGSMRPYGKLACLLAAIGVGVVPSTAVAGSSGLLSQSISPNIYQLNLPSTSGTTQSTPSTEKNKSTNKKAKKAESYKKTPYKPPLTKSPIKPKPPLTTYPLKPTPKPPLTTSPIKPKPPLTTYPIKPVPKPWYVKPPVTTTPVAPPAGSSVTQPVKPVRPKRRTFIALRKPTLACRSFRKNGAPVRGFRSRLYGPNSASALRSRLNSYQAAGGSLSRCVYSGVISPTDFSKYFKDRKPSILIRSSDNYRLPLYSSYAQLSQASGGRRARFGLLARTLPVRTASGSKDLLRITVNNALILFVDGRNQSLFKASPSKLPLRLISVSPQVQEVLSGASKTSLNRIIDYKKLKKVPLKQSFLRSPYGGHWGEEIDPNAMALLGGRPMPLFGHLPGAEPYSSLKAVFTRASSERQLLLAEVDPQIAEYCMKAQDFSGCVETMQGASEPAFPGSGGVSEEEPSGITAEEEVALEDDVECPDGTAFDFDSGDCQPDDLAAIDPEDSAPLDGEELPPEDGSGGETDEYQEDDYHNGEGMYPEDMGAPTAQACTGQTFGEQLACALVSALTTMLQQAFSSN